MFSRILITLLVLLCPTQTMAQEPQQQIPQNKSQLNLTFAPLVKQVAPAVVNIYTKRSVSKMFRNPFMDDPFFGQLFGGELFGGQMRKHVESALGSGVIVSAQGLVVTNEHVVRGADQITVVLNDGNEYEATKVLTDEASDLALLRIDETDREFPFVNLKPSESLEVGDLVLAIGNPFGVGQTVTSGIVSAQGRSSLDINDYNFFIQTDAAINPGNSGGPLVTMDGKVVGINTAIYSRSGGSLGIGFAIPSEMVASVIAASLNGQTGEHGIIRPWIGVTAQNVSTDIANSLGLDNPNGAMVSRLHSASPFREAGIKVGDVVLSVNGKAIRDAAELKFRIATVPIGKEAEVEIFRDEKIQNKSVKAIAPPENPPRNEITLRGDHVLNGVTIANLNPAVSIELGLAGEEEGVVVMSAPIRGFFRTVNTGDILMEVNGRKINKPEDVEKALKAPKSNGPYLVIKSGGRVSRLYLR